MQRIVLLCTVSLLALPASGHAQSYSPHPEPLQPRIDAGGKWGTERSLGQMEGWMPIVQDRDSVLYGDIRWMADSEESQEGNLGLGYRVMRGNHIVGVHGWIDRRRTDRGSNFHQVTGGIEFMKEDWDIKANAYMPLNKEKEYLTSNSGHVSPYMAGTGLFVDTNGTLVEEAQPGGDLEVGYRLPVLEDKIDAVRVYGGGYAFMGDRSEDVIGGRIRASVDVSPLLNVGARFQYDEPRGSQGFLEATLRFPFTAKKRFQQHGLRARLDESPERDVDIVTGAVVTDTGLRKEVINVETGTTQRVLHVDNTAANGGNGSTENPFNTLAAAQAAMLDNDVVYVHHGNGLSTGMDQGIVINKNNVQFIGSGTDFLFDTGKFSTRRQDIVPADGTIIVAAGAAPVITNTIVPVDVNDVYTGHGVLVTGDDAVVAGFEIEGAAGVGIIGRFDDGRTVNSITIHDNITHDNVNYGTQIYLSSNSYVKNVNLENNVSTNDLRGVVFTISSVGGGRVDNLRVTGNTVNDAGQVGINISPSTGGYVDSTLISDNEVNNSGTYGIYALANNGGTFNTVMVRDNTSTGSGENNLMVQANNTGSLIKDATILNNTVDGGDKIGISLTASISSTIEKGRIEGNTVTNATQSGINVSASASGVIQDVIVIDNTTEDNGSAGIRAEATSAGHINYVDIQGNTSRTNLYGILVYNNNGAYVDSATVSNNLMENNTQHGLYIYATGSASGKMSASVFDNTMTGNGTASTVDPNLYYGVSVRNNGTAPFVVDLGGGSLGSTGGNRIYNNAYRDIYIDSRPGTGLATAGVTIAAQYNWWGVNTGLNQGTRAIFDNGSASPGSSIDASNYLTTDPGL
ncbi:MAG TPA: right-handed parallel beta-helix repeat-containing protein [Alphaproteobacteria bacterium]